MPIDVFDGEPTEELHEHYDAAGNLTGSTVVTRPGWSAQARAWALGLALREATQCPRGHDLTESLDRRWKWKAKPPYVCFACVAHDAAVERHQKDPYARAMLHVLEKSERPEPKRRG